MDRYRAMDQDSRALVGWNVLLLFLALVSIFVITFELTFVHEPRLLTSIVIYAIDGVFLASIWLRRRRSHTDVADPDRSRSQELWSLGIVALGNLPIDLLFIFGDGELWGISLVLWVRLLRLIRLGSIFELLRRLERYTESNTAALRIARLVIIVGLVLQVLACVWYLIPFIQGFPIDSWPVREGLVGEGAGIAYLLSMYWVVTAATTIGFGDIVPGNTEEYAYSLVVMLVGASLFAYVIATGASLISSLNLAKVAFWHRVDTVESYLRARRIDRSVGEEVHRYFEYVWDRHGVLRQDTLLSDLPPALRLEVMSELLRDLLSNVPIFRHASPALRNELLLSLDPIVTQPGGFLVTDGDVADGIYFIAGGQVEVISADGKTVYGTLTEGDYFGDLTLLLGERRSASVRSVGFSETFQLDAASYERIRSDYPELREVLTKSSQERTSTLTELVLEGVVL